MSGGIYTAEHIISNAGQLDFFELLAAADHAIEIISASLAQDSEAADAQAEMMGLQWIYATGSYTSGSGGGGAARGHHKGAGTSGATAELLNTTQAVVGLGTFTDLSHDAFNVQIGFLHQPVPEERYIISPSDAIICAFTKAPADGVDWKARVTWKEWGG